MGLEFDHPQGAKLVMRRLYEHGVWAIFSTLDPRVLQFKPGILLGPDMVDEVLDRTGGVAGPPRSASASRALRPAGRMPRARRGRAALAAGAPTRAPG